MRLFFALRYARFFLFVLYLPERDLFHGDLRLRHGRLEEGRVRGDPVYGMLLLVFRLGFLLELLRIRDGIQVLPPRERQRRRSGFQLFRPPPVPGLLRLLVLFLLLENGFLRFLFQLLRFRHPGPFRLVPALRRRDGVRFVLFRGKARDVFLLFRLFDLHLFLAGGRVGFLLRDVRDRHTGPQGLLFP